MAGELVPGGAGTIPLHQIPAARARGGALYSFAAQKFDADMYEEEHPEITVRRPWETDEQHSVRLAKRRRQTPLAELPLNMDPSRAEAELGRKQAELQGLTPDHPAYERMFTSLVGHIHDLEAILGRRPTQYSKGVVPKRPEVETPKELLEKLAKYKGKTELTRRKSIEATDDLDFLALIRDNETLPDLQALAIQRITQLRSAAEAEQ